MWLCLGSRIWLAAAPVDMRLGFDGLAAMVQVCWPIPLVGTPLSSAPVAAIA
jgi:hypothetical protein